MSPMTYGCNSFGVLPDRCDPTQGCRGSAGSILGFATESRWDSSKPFGFHRRQKLLYMARCLLLWVLVLYGAVLHALAASWLVRVEEPTGLYPRTNELVAVPYARLGSQRGPWIITDPQGKELAWQASRDALLFPATLIPGEPPEYRIRTSAQTATNFVNGILVRKLGLNRVEVGNRFFRVLIDLQAGAIIEAYNLSAQPPRVLNLVETTPEEPEALKDDIHAAEAMGITPVAGVPMGNLGWTSLGSTGAITSVEVVEEGPLRGKLRLGRPQETWELTWAADSRALGWRARNGFRFTAISASPYLPFDRCVGGSEYEWPNGPDDLEPPDHEIQPRQWNHLPGGHVVYYNHAENYGALGIISADTNLTWTGIGSRRFLARAPEGPTEIGLTFPQWDGSNTVLQARREYRVSHQPLIFEVSKANDDRAGILR
ncbi:MAG TPA: hypothetical protein VFE51_15045, partial [Verrucomicrobiae bacterium]|nr:hypothetical protein [Verrucomicrobiae bacterium]